MRRRGVWLLAAMVAGCSSSEEAPPAPEPPQVVTRYEPPAAPEAPPEPELCATLASFMAGGEDGFAKLRGEPLEDERWSSAQTLPGTSSCVIEGAEWPRARFSCASQPLPEDEVARVEFQELAAEIDRCLAKPIWFPRNWEKGQTFEFAMGERQVAWTDQSTAPPTAVVLKVQQDIASRDYQVRLDLEAVR